MRTLPHNKHCEIVRILGIPISVLTLDAATKLLSTWAQNDRYRTVFVREVASLMAAVDETRLGALHEEADVIVADGMPLVWCAKFRGAGSRIGRVAGADLVDAISHFSLHTGQTHYFFGGKPGVAQQMADQLGARYPGLKTVGVYSPPMRDIGPDFELDRHALEEIEHIRAAKPDFVWVGISSPKQEYWMMKAAPLIGHGVFIGVGAAFDFHSGAVKRAPRWMRDNGFEWLHRLLSEPRRLWRRYLLLAPKFIAAVALEEFSRLRRRSLTGGADSW